MKKILITGGSRGIGAACVRLFAGEGRMTAFTYVHSGDDALALARETGALAFRCDQRDEQDVNELKAALPFTPDVLVLNAGVSSTGLFQDTTAEEWDRVFDTNVRGSFLIARAFLPGMISRKSGSVIFISSMWGQTGAACECAYSASKAALIGLTKALAKETGPSGVRVNCVCPGVIMTDMMKSYTAEDIAALAEDTPLERNGTPQDVAKAVYFLAGENASFITGQVLPVNGGFVI